MSPRVKEFVQMEARRNHLLSLLRAENNYVCQVYSSYVAERCGFQARLTSHTPPAHWNAKALLNAQC